MTGGATEPPVQIIDQVSFGVAHGAGGGGGHFCRVRDVAWVNIKIRVAIHTITRTMGEGRAFEQAGR